MKQSSFYLGLVLMMVCVMLSGCDTSGWIKYMGNPVLAPGGQGSWGETDVERPSVIHDNGTYKMWYAGEKDDVFAIGHATSSDGIDWVKDVSNPVLEAGQAGSWDSVCINGPAVIKEGDTYKMWYMGFSEPDDLGGSIGYATSTDGISWTKYEENPVLEAGDQGAWDVGGVRQPTVIKDGDTYEMWYGGVMEGGDDSYAVGYATSTDGINWTKDSSNPVFESLATGWDNESVEDPSVIKDDGTYRMWYFGIGAFAEGFGYATSTDGINWTQQGSTPVLTMGAFGAWDSNEIFNPHVIKDGTTLKMWYSGEGGADEIDSIGYATLEEDVDS